MPWTKDGGGGGGWKGGPGGPWGQGPSNGGGNNNPPDLEEILRRSQDKLRQAMPGGFGVFGTLVILLIVAGAVGFLGFTVRPNPNERAVVLRFGKFDRELGPGLNFRWPYPIEEVTVLSTGQKQVEVGSSAGTSGPYGSIRTPDRGEEGLMLTGDGNIVDVTFNVQWNIKSPSDYLFSMRNPSNNPDVDANVKAVAESAMREIIGKNASHYILTEGRQEIEEAAKALMQRTLDSYNGGIQILKVNLHTAVNPKGEVTAAFPEGEVIAAFRDVQAAKADQERARNEAETYANRVIPEARGQVQQIIQAAQGYREQAVAEARGRTERFLKVYQEYQKAPDVTRRRMYLEMMEEVLGGMDKIILDEKANAGSVVPYLPLSDLQRQNQAGGQR
jgi:membrane protease subunit HflK